MKKKILESTASRPLGSPPQHALMRVPAGEFAGRNVILVQTDPSTICLSRSDAPDATWSSLQTVADDAADYNYDCRMSAAGDIHLVYSEQGTGYLVTRKLTFDNGSWSVGPKVTIYDGAQCFDPSLAIDSTGRLWVSWSRFVSPTRLIQVKSSADGGATWGSGPSDAGDQVSNGSMFADSKLLCDASAVHVIYHDQDTALYVRSLPLIGGSWSAQTILATGSGFTSDLDAAVGPDGRLGVVYSQSAGLYYCEFDGVGWASPVQLFDAPVQSPQLRFEDTMPVVVFLESIGGFAWRPVYTLRLSGMFSSAAPLDSAVKQFDSVTLWGESPQTFESATGQAASTDDADVYHSVSGKLLQDAGDAVYLGMDVRFNLIHMRLSTVGVGGTLLIAYWDGAEWQAFTPETGSVGFDATDNVIVLWPDHVSIPVDWQKGPVNSENRFWIRIAVVSPYTTGPVAGQITAVPLVKRICVRR
jgi:hypothetical protein